MSHNNRSIATTDQMQTVVLFNFFSLLSYDINVRMDAVLFLVTNCSFTYLAWWILEHPMDQSLLLAVVVEAADVAALDMQEEEPMDHQLLVPQWHQRPVHSKDPEQDHQLPLIHLPEIGLARYLHYPAVSKIQGIQIVIVLYVITCK